MAKSIVMLRILKVEKKNRVRINMCLEKELQDAVKTHHLHMSDLINETMERELIKRGLINPDLSIKNNL